MNTNADALTNLATARRSTRGFLAEEVPRSQIEAMLQVAQNAPSWCNTQSWKIHITSGETTERLRKLLVDSAIADPTAMNSDYPMPSKYEGVFKERRRASGWGLYEAVGIERGDREASALQALKNYEFFGAPHVAVITVDASQEVYGVLDAGVYLGHLVLAAEALGIGTVAQAALAMHAPVLREFFGLPDEERVLVGMSFGYADPENPANTLRTGRAELADVATWHD